MSFSPQQLLAQLPTFSPQQTLWLAYSGGLDSTCLLHAIAELKSLGKLCCAVHAIHINHGLSQHADVWQQHCAAQAAAWGLSFECVAVDAQPRTGESPEAVARNARYQAFAQRINQGDLLLTAHHQDDQAETLLLQLLRGSGVKGLAAMPISNNFSAGVLYRPMLPFSRASLQTYATQRQLDWIEDESNQCDDFDRNFLRNQIFPQLQQRWPSITATFSRSASHCAQSAQLCDELAVSDLNDVMLDDPMTLSVAGLSVLNLARKNNLLRYWIGKQGLPLPTTRQLEQITQRLMSAKQDATPVVTWPGGELRRFSAKLYLMTPITSHDASQVLDWPVEQPSLFIESLGLTLQRSELSVAMDKTLRVCFRQGGESIRLPGKHHHTSLKKLFQQHGVPPWQRDRLPLLYEGNELMEIVGLRSIQLPD